jgi:hypothetical protein
MASPHVAGVAALYLEGNPPPSPATVAGVVNASATAGTVTSPGGGSPNRLLYPPLGAPPPPPPLPPPPPPPPGCGLAQGFSGSLSATGASALLPNGSSYQSATAGAPPRLPARTGDGRLRPVPRQAQRHALDAGPPSRRASTSDEDVTYNAPAGTCRWRVVSYGGSGAYTFGLTKPS